MEIRSFKFLVTLVFISYHINIQSFQDISSSTIQYISNEGSEVRVNSKDINRKNPLFGVTLDLTKTFDKNNKELISNLSAEYKGNLENNLKNDYILESGQFIQIKKHNRELLFDGSFFIYFKEIRSQSYTTSFITITKCMILVN